MCRHSAKNKKKSIWTWVRACVKLVWRRMLRPKLPQPQMNESQLEHTLHLTTSIKTQSCKTNSGKLLCIIFKEFDCQDAYKCQQRDVLTLPPPPHTHMHTHRPILIQREFSEVYICVTTVTEIYIFLNPVFSSSIWCHWRAASQEACWRKRRVGKATRAEGHGDCAEGEGHGVKRAASPT